MVRTRPPGPRGQWLIGDVRGYEADRMGWLRRTRDEYGDVVRLAPDTIVVHHRVTAHSVLASTNDAFLLDTSLLAGRRHRRRAHAGLDAWQTTRRDVWHGFADRIARDHLHRLVDVARAEFDAGAGEEHDLLDVCRRVCGRALVDFCVGGDDADPTLVPELVRHADALFTSALSVLASGEARVRWAPRPGARAVTARNAELNAVLLELVRRRRRDREPRDLLGALLARGTAERAAVRALRTALFASHGVPGAALSWVLLRLAEHPSSAERPDAFVKETLRLHPPQWLLARTVRHPTPVSGYPRRAGSQVLVCPYLLHRDSRYWQEPEVFRPSRWLGRHTPHLPHAYLPFGAGPRVCPGANLGFRQLVALTSLVAGELTMTLPPVGAVDVDCNGLLVPEGVTVRW
jgi:cytochrome P450